MMNLRTKALLLLIMVLVSSSLTFASVTYEATLRGFHEPIFTTVIRHYEGEEFVNIAPGTDVLVQGDLLTEYVFVDNLMSIGISGLSNKLNVRLTGNNDQVLINGSSVPLGPLIDLYGETIHRLRISQSNMQRYEISTQNVGVASSIPHIIFNPGGNIGFGTSEMPASKVDIHSSVRIAGQLNMANNRIMNVANPEYQYDVVNRLFVDQLLASQGSAWSYQLGSYVNIERSTGNVLIGARLGVDLPTLDAPKQRVHSGGDVRVTGAYMVGDEVGVTDSFSYKSGSDDCIVLVNGGIITSIICETSCIPLTCSDREDLKSLNEDLNCGLGLNAGCGVTIDCLHNCALNEVCTYDHTGLEFMYQGTPARGYCALDQKCNPVVEVAGIRDSGRQFCVVLRRQSFIDACQFEHMVGQHTHKVFKTVSGGCVVGGDPCSSFFTEPVAWVDDVVVGTPGYFALTENNIVKGQYYIDDEDITFTPLTCS